MKKKILIVDDTRLMRNIIRDALTHVDNFEFFEAANGREAVDSYFHNKPDLVTMDITMDLKDGVEATKEILDLDRDAKIIMITALSQQKLLKDCITAGVRDYVVKPFTQERLSTAVKKVFVT
jgi:two-component system, chemotaxis family, chemotaxis protein CheY